eukprot:363859-Amphidinium_carterae.1
METVSDSCASGLGFRSEAVCLKICITCCSAALVSSVNSVVVVSTQGVKPVVYKLRVFEHSESQGFYTLRARLRLSSEEVAKQYMEFVWSQVRLTYVPQAESS